MADIPHRVRRLLEHRPTGSKAMMDFHGAKARLRDARPGAWVNSTYTGWKWAKWPTGDAGWLTADIELSASLQVSATDDVK